MAAKTITEKISEKQTQLKKIQDRISADREKEARIKKEIETLQSLEVKELLKEIDMPIEKVKELLAGMKKQGTPQ